MKPQTAAQMRTPPSYRKGRIAYRIGRGSAIQGCSEDVLSSSRGAELRHRVQLVLTSPPFPLNRKKEYGNLRGDSYLKWLSGFAMLFRDVLKADGSIVMEMGNAWEQGRPVMSTLTHEALLAFLEAGRFKLCQQFICYNPARLPSPVQWVNIKRSRVKDSFTHVWWMSPSDQPKADNRQVLREYSPAMKSLLRSKKYNSGKRPSNHTVGKKSFLKDNRGAIPSNVLTYSNTKSNDQYLLYCRERDLKPHPARMPPMLAEFFIKFLSSPQNLILDPFAGSNTTGATAEKLKRRWIAIEPRPDYLLASRGRFSARFKKANANKSAKTKKPTKAIA